MAGSILNLVLSRIEEVKDRLLPRYGWFPSEPSSPRWWGGFRSGEEIIVAAVLAQLTRWDTVDKVVASLREQGLTSLARIASMSVEELAEKIRGVGFHVEKARRLLEIARLSEGSLEGLCRGDARSRLLSVRGVGRETADTILLFACNKLVFPASRLGVRVLSRLGLKARGYEEWRKIVESELPRSLYHYKLMHAGLVTVTRAFCFKTRPRCSECVFSSFCPSASRLQARRP